MSAQPKKLSPDMNPKFFKTNQRVADAFFNSVDPDYYSSDGQIWDPHASTMFFVETTSKFNAELLKEAAKKELKAESLDDLSPALSEFVLRVEKRVAERASAPIERNYETNIGYMSEDSKSGERTLGYVDLKKAADADLQSIVEDVPEARLELMYRALTQDSSKTNEQKCSDNNVQSRKILPLDGREKPMENNVMNVWFYANPQTKAVDGVYAFFPMGMFIRQDGDWNFITREESRIGTDLKHDDVYQLDWDTDEKEIDEAFMSEGSDPDHIAVKMYDNGVLDIGELEKYADKIIDHGDITPSGDFTTEQ